VGTSKTAAVAVRGDEIISWWSGTSQEDGATVVFVVVVVVPLPCAASAAPRVPTVDAQSTAQSPNWMELLLLLSVVDVVVLVFVVVPDVFVVVVVSVAPPAAPDGVAGARDSPLSFWGCG
jgi:hypothetical protein